MRAFDEAGQIGDNKRAAQLSAMPASAAIRIDDAEIWIEGCERIIRNFGPGRGNHRDQRGFARIGKPDKANVGEQLQFETKVALFTGETVFVFARGLVPGFGKILIAAAAASTLRDQ